MKVLIADDNIEILTFLSDILEKEGFFVLKAHDGAETLRVYKAETPDFICLDIEMPDIKGYDVCREIRKKDEQTPIIFLSSRNEAKDKITGLELGADDYIIKPFDMGELIARIRAVARRCLTLKSPNETENSFQMQMLTILPNQLRVKRGQQTIDISLREIKILTLLKNYQNRVVTRQDLVDQCWNGTIVPESRTIDLHISKLRKKIEIKPDAPEIIKTVHGVGYRFNKN